LAPGLNFKAKITIMRFVYILLLIAVLPFSCSKKELLESRSSNAAFVPTTADDFQGLLDDELLFGQNCFLTYLSTDEIFIPDGTVDALRTSSRNAYLWRKIVFDTVEAVPDWDQPYAQVLSANEVMAGVTKLLAKEKSARLNALLGDAYFKRAFSFFNLAQVFAPPYDLNTATTELGIPLRLSTDNKEKLYRSKVQETYDQIISDLRTAIQLLPATVDSLHPNRASQPAAWALLSRVYLGMGDYQQAATAATKCLNLYDKLIDYNQLNGNSATPFSFRNKETLYQSKIMQGNTFATLFLAKGAVVEPELIRSYQPGDLRTAIFFSMKPAGATLKGSMFGEIYPFSGIGTAEVFLTLAECNVRLGHTAVALQYINQLLKNRWVNNQFTPYADTSADKVLQFILQERKKELVLKGMRWTDLRRLNRNGANIELKRTYQAGVLVLPANDTRYVFPIPDDVLQFNNYPQNNR
jgi:starch-binding outer membrane protein, SusD/RagB family